MRSGAGTLFVLPAHVLSNTESIRYQARPTSEVQPNDKRDKNMVTVAGLATIAAGFIAVGGASFGAGVFLQRRKDSRQEMLDEHKEMMEAHRLLHSDIDKLINQHSDIQHTSTYGICPLCNDMKEMMTHIEPEEEE